MKKAIKPKNHIGGGFMKKSAFYKELEDIGGRDVVKAFKEALRTLPED
jgi:hypothetical protein